VEDDLSDETREPEAKGPEGEDSETGGQTSGANGPSSGANGSEEQGRSRNARDRVSEGFSRGLGVLSAFKEALEETISEARERGDLSVERAREAMKGAVGRAREATSDARERFDFVSQAEFDTLVRRVRELEERMDASESAPEGDATGEP
jgi:polyhydroxyalkanoate synthesis regulator phasin